MVETKFKIGDKVWFLDTNTECFAKKELVLTATQCVVCGIKVNIEEWEETVTYRLMKVGELAKEVENGGYYEEQYLAKTKEEVQKFIKRISDHFTNEVL